jgi:hypothetical protein
MEKLHWHRQWELNGFPDVAGVVKLATLVARVGTEIKGADQTKIPKWEPILAPPPRIKACQSSCTRVGMRSVTTAPENLAHSPKYGFTP